MALKDMHMLRRHSISLALLASLSACQPTPSPESKDLQSSLVPRIIAWSKNGGVFNLSQAIPSGTYDMVCIIPEYNCLRGLKILGRIDEHHSAFGMCIPENDSAIVLVGGHKAHAALIDGAKLRFDVLSYGECAPASGAVLRSNPESWRYSPIADLAKM